MKQKTVRMLLCLVLAVLLAAAALTLTGCGKQKTPAESTQAQTEAPKTEAQTEAPKTEAQTETARTTGEEAPGTTAHMEAPEIRTVVGEGEHLFDLDIVFSSGEKALYTVQTNAANVGDALLENKLVEGEDTEWGLYIKTIKGETHDYDADGSYWSFYIDGEYAATGVSQTEITDGALYTLKAEGGQ